MLKIAISGKGGVGKTLLAASLAKIFSKNGYSVLAIDADSNPGLAAVLGYPDPERMVPISEMADLIKERTGASPGTGGSYFKLNPRVDDIPDKYAAKLDNIKLMVMGHVKRGGSGCYCAENALLASLLSHLLLQRDEVVIIDMEAGIEHLGRATAKAVNKLIVVVEPGQRSIETALRIKMMANDIGINNIAVVGNKIRSQSDIDIIQANLPGFEILGMLPYDQAIVDADLAKRDIFSSSKKIYDKVVGIYDALLKESSLPRA